jgi:hypothetical protein
LCYKSAEVFETLNKERWEKNQKKLIPIFLAKNKMKTVKSSSMMAMMGGGGAGAAKAATPSVTMDLHRFLSTHAGYKYGPLIVTAVLAASWQVPAVADFYASRSLEPWGLANAATYTVFAIWSMFAVHGLVCCYRWGSNRGPRHHHTPKPILPYHAFKAPRLKRSWATIQDFLLALAGVGEKPLKTKPPIFGLGRLFSRLPNPCPQSDNHLFFG